MSDDDMTGARGAVRLIDDQMADDVDAVERALTDLLEALHSRPVVNILALVQTLGVYLVDLKDQDPLAAAQVQVILQAMKHAGTPVSR